MTQREQAGKQSSQKGGGPREQMQGSHLRKKPEDWMCYLQQAVAWICVLYIYILFLILSKEILGDSLFFTQGFVIEWLGKENQVHQNKA